MTNDSEEAFDKTADAGNATGPVALAPGMTLVFPANVRHQFRTLGFEPLKTLGVHTSPHRIVVVHEDNLAAGDDDRPVGPA